MKVYRFACLALVASLLSGCLPPGIIQRGHDFDMNRVALFKPGVTTLEDVEAVCGPPFAQGTLPDGTLDYHWGYGENGMLTTHSKRLEIVFAPDHKMIRIANQQVIE